MKIRNKIKVTLVTLCLGATGIAGAANTCPVKVTQSNDEISRNIKAIINGENGKEPVELIKNIDLPNITVGNGAIDQFTGGFSFTPDSDLVAKAIVKPNLKNVSNLLLYRKTLAYASKLNLGQLRAYAQGILDYQAQNPSDTAESEALASFAHGVIDYYNIFINVLPNRPLTDNEKKIVQKHNYLVFVLASAFSKDSARKNDLVKSEDGIYKGVSDASCNYSESCNGIVSKANDLYMAKAMGSNQDIYMNKQIINNSVTYAQNLALLDTSPKVYQALKDTKNQAYQKAQLAMLTDIDQQLRKLNQKQN